MKVIFDIAVLGLGHRQPKARTGVFRAIENLAYGLSDSPACELSFCATNGLDDCLDYLHANPRLTQIPLIHPHRRAAQMLLNARHMTARAPAQVHRLVWNGLKKIAFWPDTPGNTYLHRMDERALDQTDIFHSPFWPIPDQVRRKKKIATVLTIYDLFPILYPDLFEAYQLKWFVPIFRTIQPQDRIIAISQATKNDLCTHLHVNPDRVTVVYLAASDNFYPCTDPTTLEAIRAKYHIPNSAPYILTVGTLEPRKNLVQVLQSFSKLIREAMTDDFRLVVVGTKGWQYAKIFEMIANEALSGRVIFTGYVPDADLAPLYSGALTFVYLSLSEGFGLPPLEAMQCGIPVITSNNSSFPEIVGTGGILLAPDDGDGLCQQILQIYHNPILRQSLGAKAIRRAQEFSWTRCIQETVGVYNSALEG